MSTRPAVSRRRPGVRKKKILEVASDLFHRYGYHAVGMDEIGEAAGVTGPAIYSHFPGKSALLVAVLERIMDDLGDVDDLLSDAGGAREALRRLVVHQVDFAISERPLIYVYLHEERNLPPAERRRLRLKQHAYVDRWVEYVLEANRGMDPAEALSLVHGVFNFIASVALYEPKLDDTRLRTLLERHATALLFDHKSKSA